MLGGDFVSEDPAVEALGEGVFADGVGVDAADGLGGGGIDAAADAAVAGVEDGGGVLRVL
jgi:hypothetical protein